MPVKSLNRKRSMKDSFAFSQATPPDAGSALPSPILVPSPVMSQASWSAPQGTRTPPTPSAPSKMWSSLKNLARSPHSSSKKRPSGLIPAVPAMPDGFVPVVNNVTEPSVQPVRWDAHGVTTPPLAQQRVHQPRHLPQKARQASQQIPIPQIFIRADTPPPTLEPPTTSDHTPYSPPFDPAFEQAAASCLFSEEGLADSNGLSGLGVSTNEEHRSTLSSARLPSMRFDDMSIFIADLEQRIYAADGQRTDRKTKRSSRRVSAMPDLPSPESSSSLSLLTASGAGASSARTSKPSHARTKSKTRNVPVPIAIPDHVAETATRSAPPRVETFHIPSPRLSSLPCSPALLPSLFPELPQVKIQPPTPNPDNEEFTAPVPLRPKKHSRLRSVHRIPAKQATQTSPTGSTNSMASTSTPPLSPSQTNSTLSLDETLATSEDEDGEAQLEGLMALLKRPYSAVLKPAFELPKQGENSFELLDGPDDDDNYAPHLARLSDANLRIHNISALSTLQRDTRRSIHELSKGASPLSDDDDDDDDGTGHFDDAPLLKHERSQRLVSELSTSIYVNHSRTGDLGLALFDTQSEVSSPPSSPERSRKRESLWDLQDAVVSMADRVSVLHMKEPDTPLVGVAM